jgi:hypothetical protein
MCAEFALGWISTYGFVAEPVWCRTPVTIVVSTVGGQAVATACDFVAAELCSAHAVAE